MSRTIGFAVLLGLSLTAHSAVLSESSEHHSRKELKAQMKSAHSPEQYQTLSLYFNDEASRYKQLAHEQEAIMSRELERPTRLKFPSAYDLASRRRDYYLYRVDKAEQQKNSYVHLLQASN